MEVRVDAARCRLVSTQDLTISALSISFNTFQNDTMRDTAFRYESTNLNPFRGLGWVDNTSLCVIVQRYLPVLSLICYLVIYQDSTKPDIIWQDDTTNINLSPLSRVGVGGRGVPRRDITIPHGFRRILTKKAVGDGNPNLLNRKELPLELTYPRCRPSLPLEKAASTNNSFLA